MDYKKLALGLGAFVGGSAALIGGALFADRYARRDKATPGSDTGATGASIADVTASGEPTAEHVPVDLMSDTPPAAYDRAPVAFRPDMDAPMSPAEREALRPATGGAPGFSADRGSGFTEAAGAA